MSENKEIDECVKELGYCYNRLKKHICEGKLCEECPLEEPHDDCLIIKLLIKLRDSIERLEEKQQ